MVTANPVLDAPHIANFGLSLVVVIAAILVIGWFYSRMRIGAGKAGDVINVVASRPLGPKERLMVIEIGDQQLLVGMTATQLQTLHIFDKPVVDAGQAVDQEGFAGRLKSALLERAK